jgi:hypothetical protein
MANNNRQQEKASAHTRTRKLTIKQQKNKNETVRSATTCKKGQQKQRSRFLQEYKSKHHTHLKMAM